MVRGGWVIGDLVAPLSLGIVRPVESASQAHRKTPPYVAGPSSGVFWSGRSAGGCRQPDRAKSCPPLSHPPPTGQLMAHRKACAQCNAGVKPPRRITKARRIRKLRASALPPHEARVSAAVSWVVQWKHFDYRAWCSGRVKPSRKNTKARSHR